MKQPTLSILLLALAAVTAVQAQISSIGGRVLDSSGGAIESAQVWVEQAGGGARGATLTNQEGLFRIPALPAADYVIHAKAPNFAEFSRAVSLLVGQALDLELQLHPAAVSTAVEVVGVADLVSITSSELSGNIDSHQMQDVPLNGRNWVELALLLPGISKNDVTNGSMINGNGPGRFQLNVDGQQVTQTIAGPGTGEPRVSRDALAEFQIVTNTFDATLGRASRMQVNAQTRSGSDEFHGGAFAYFRNSDLGTAADPVAHKALPYSNQQIGGSVGGPVKRHKLWFFGTFENQREPATVYTVPTGFGGQPFQFPNLTVTRPLLARLDYQASDASRFSLRLNGFTTASPFSGVSGNTHPSRAASTYQKAGSLLGTWSKTFSPQLVNDLKAGFNYFLYGGQPVVGGYEFRFGSTTVGGNYNYPANRFQNTYQIRDDLFWQKGRHSIKLGGEYLNDWIHGIYPQNSRGVVTSFKSSTPTNLAQFFPVWNDPSTWNLAALSPYANSFLQGFGDFSLSMHRNVFGVWAQDDWRVAPRLTLNLGVRYDNDLGMFGNSIYLKSGLATPHKNQNTNFAPRIGFAWDALGNHKTVVRGGAGLFYADLEGNVYFDQQLFNGQTSLQASVDATSTTPLNLAQPFGAYTGADFLNGTAPAPTQAIQLIDPNQRTPYSVQSSLGVERELGRNWFVSADWAWLRVYHEWIRLDQNLYCDPVTGFNQNPNVAGRPDSRFTSITRSSTLGGAITDSLLVSLRRRFASGAEVAAAYTLSKARDNTDGPFYVPNNQFNLGGEWGNAAADQRHTLNVSGSYRLKWGFQLSGLFRYGSGAAYGVTAGGSPFGIAAPAGSGGTNRTFLATTKVYNDPSLNHVLATAPQYLVVDRNSFYGQPIVRLDSRLAKTISIKERYRIIGQFEVFNLLNHANYGGYTTAITSASYGLPAQSSDLSYTPRMLQLAARFEF